jgi:hypothetical protein
MHQIIYEANLARALEIILIILIIYYVFSFIARYILPSLLKKYLTNLQQGFTSQNQAPREKQTQKKEGEISITYIEKDKNKPHTPHDGEYVDYEEIK